LKGGVYYEKNSKIMAIQKRKKTLRAWFLRESPSWLDFPKGTKMRFTSIKKSVSLSGGGAFVPPKNSEAPTDIKAKAF